MTSEIITGHSSSKALYKEEAKNLPSALLCKGWVTGRRKCPENDIGLSLYHDYINDKRTL
jgi:hypothetical protein